MQSQRPNKGSNSSTAPKHLTQQHKKFTTMKKHQKTPKNQKKPHRIHKTSSKSSSLFNSQQKSLHSSIPRSIISMPSFNTTSHLGTTQYASINTLQGKKISQQQRLFTTKENKNFFSAKSQQFFFPTKNQHNFNPPQIFPKKTSQSTSLRSFSSAPLDANVADASEPSNCSDPLILELFLMLNKGLKPMFENNPGYSITTEGDIYEFSLGKDRSGEEMGIYHFERDPNEAHLMRVHPHVTKPVVYMTSPVSGGVFRYFYDAKRLEQWVSVDDEHYMVELLTREVLKKCYGYPQF